MSTTISRGKMFAVTVEVSDERLRAMKEMKGNAEDALMAGADYWHTGILPKHFEQGAAAKYGYAVRSKNYIVQMRRRGGLPLLYTGSMRDELESRASFQRVGMSVNLKMFAHSLNFAPTMPENSDSTHVRHSTRARSGRGALYPNLKREIKIITDDEREAVAVVITKELERSMAPTDYMSRAAPLAPPVPTSM